MTKVLNNEPVNDVDAAHKEVRMAWLQALIDSRGGKVSTLATDTGQNASLLSAYRTGKRVMRRNTVIQIAQSLAIDIPEDLGVGVRMLERPLSVVSEPLPVTPEQAIQHNTETLKRQQAMIEEMNRRLAVIQKLLEERMGNEDAPSSRTSNSAS